MLANVVCAFITGIWGSLCRRENERSGALIELGGWMNVMLSGGFRLLNCCER